MYFSVFWYCRQSPWLIGEVYKWEDLLAQHNVQDLQEYKEKWERRNFAIDADAGHAGGSSFTWRGFSL